ncbi:MAG TPA: CBS domain-containing protein [Elusimicrobiota bacterium]|nr:CBS domain-containing protein [Elusimicrobiota bacterium]
MKIKDLMTVDAEVLDPGSTVEEAAQAMADADVGSLPVLRRGKVVGMLTDRDIAVRVVAEGLAPRETKIEQVMTSDVVSCSEDDDVETAARIMSENQIRRLVVVDDAGEFAGIVALADLALRTGEGSEVLGEVSRPSSELTQGVYTGGPAQVNHVAESAGAALVSDELAAIDTYKQVLQTVTSGKAGDALRRIENEHEEAARLLKDGLRRIGVEAPRRAGGARAWAASRRKAGELPDDKSSISLLRDGERREIEDYESALDDDSLDPGIKKLIESSLLPKTRAHVPALDRFLSEGPVG